MLVLSRQRDESVILGNENTTYIEFTPEDLINLQRCTDPDLVALCKRLLDAPRGIMKVTVVDIRVDKTRLGFDAPRQVDIHREEIYKVIQREKREAQQIKPEDPSTEEKKTG